MTNKVTKSPIIISFSQMVTAPDTFWRTIVTIIIGAVNDIGLHHQDRVVIDGIFNARWGQSLENLKIKEIERHAINMPPTLRRFANLRQTVASKIFEFSRTLSKTEGLDKITLYRKGKTLCLEYQTVSKQLDKI